MDNIIQTTKEDLEKLKNEAFENGKNSVKNNNLPFENKQLKDDKGIGFARVIKNIFEAHNQNGGLKAVSAKQFEANPTALNERIAKALEISDFSNGGALVPSEFMNEVIPYLNNNSVFFGKIPQVPMATGSLTIPKETSEATIFWGGELSTTSKDGSHTYGDIQLSAKKLDAQIVVSNQLLRGANAVGIDLEMQIMNKLTREMSAAAELKILEGTGSSNTPLGVYNRVASGQKFNSAGTTLANVTADLIGAIEKIEASNIMIENGQWVMSSRTKNYLMQLRNSLGVTEFMTSLAGGTLMNIAAGYTNYISNAYSSTYSRIYLMDLAKMLMGISKNLSIQVFPYGTYVDKSGNVQSGIQKDTTTIMATLEFDFGMYYNTAAAIIEQVNYK